MAIRDDVVFADLLARIENAVTTLSAGNQQRKRAWSLFTQYREPTGDAAQITSSDVNSMITAACAQMVTSFSTDTVVTYECESADDEQAAAAESRAVNKIAIEDNGGYSVILGAIQNGLMYRNGYIKIFWDIDTDDQVIKVENVEYDELPLVMAVDPQDQPNEKRRLVSYDRDTKVARVEVTHTQKRLRVKTVANERFFYDPEWDELNLSQCPMAGEIHYKTRNELSRMGVPWAKVKDLPAVARNSGEEYGGNVRMNQSQWQGGRGVVSQMDIVRVYEVYAWLTFKQDDDRAYLYHLWLPDGGPDRDFLLDPEQAGRTPYAAGTAFPIANQHEGEALSDKVAGVQESKTAFLSQWLENVKNCSFGRLGAVVGGVELEDVLSPKGGRPIRMKRPDSIVPIPVADVGPSIQLALRELDKQRTERGGAAVEMIGAEMQIAGDSAHGVERMYAAAELLVSYMTRNMAESLIRGVFLLAHAELRDGDGGPINIKIADQYQTVDPGQWKARSYCNVDVGYSMGERMHVSQTLFQALQMYGQALAQGLEGEVVSKQGLYKMTVDWMRVNLVDNPESYFIDPGSQQAQQAAQAKQQQAAQQAQQTADQASQIAALPEQIAAQKDKYKSDQETAFKYFDSVLTAMTQQSAAESKGVIDFANARAEAEAIQRAGPATPAGAAKGNGTGGASGKGGKPKPAAKQ